MENWRYKARAITKYIPKNYNSEGVFIYNEWTSRSDIGKKKDSVTNAILTQERYLEVEDNYINSVKISLSQVLRSRLWTYHPRSFKSSLYTIALLSAYLVRLFLYLVSETKSFAVCDI